MKKKIFTNILLASSVLILELMFAVTGSADRIKNGNELALEFFYVSTKSETAKQAFRQKYTRFYVNCRYLKIIEIKKDEPRKGAITLITVEPSSDMKISLVLTKKVSLKLARTLSVGEYVAGNGRVKSLGVEASDLIVLDPAILRYKDRSGPKLGPELLHEVDPNAF